MMGSVTYSLQGDCSFVEHNFMSGPSPMAPVAKAEMTEIISKSLLAGASDLEAGGTKPAAMGMIQ